MKKLVCTIVLVSILLGYRYLTVNGSNLKKEENILNVNKNNESKDNESNIQTNITNGFKKEDSLKLNKKSLKLNVGESFQLKVTGNIESISWESTNENIAIVKDGLVVAKSKGKCEIVANVREKELICKVEIIESDIIMDNNPVVDNHKVKNPTLNKSDLIIYVGESFKMDVTGTDSKVKWKELTVDFEQDGSEIICINREIMSVNDQGVVKGIRPGTGKVIAEVDGKTLECKVTIKVKDLNRYCYEFAKQAFDLHNKEREEEGLEKLVWREEVYQAASIRAKEIVTLYSHKRPSGKSCFTVLEGIENYVAGENIAMGYDTPKDVVEGWMDSLGHRKNILNKNFTKVGIGCYYENGELYWATLFIG